MAFECVLRAWQEHQAELRHFLLGQLREPALSDDMLQEVFLKAMREGRSFCELDNPRSWLFRVARNALTDNYRLQKNWVPVPEYLPDHPDDAADPVAELDVCIRRALPDLSDEDREILEACDLGPLSQEDFASRQAISLPATKARIRRARQRLRDQLAIRCHIVWDDSDRVCCHAANREV